MMTFIFWKIKAEFALTTKSSANAECNKIFEKLSKLKARDFAKGLWTKSTQNLHLKQFMKLMVSMDRRNAVISFARIFIQKY